MEAKEKNNIKEPAGGSSPPAPKTTAPNAEPLAPTLEVSQLIANERNALSDEALQFLDAHLIANPSHALNERCFRQSQSFKPVTITFANLRANSKAFLTLQDDQQAIWSDGGEGGRLVGLSLSSRVDPVIHVRSFLFNAREMVLQTYKDCHEIQIGLYLRTDQRSIKGRVDLPPDASVTLQSNSDRSTVIGMSSFAIDLD